MIAGLGGFFSKLSQRYIPDPFIFALLLTLLTLLLGVVLTSSNVAEMVGYWMGSFWDLLSFGMQMALILVTGGALAQSPPIKKLLNFLARLPQGTRGAIVLVSSAAMLSALLNWGLGLIVGAFLAREVAASLKSRGVSHHYPLIGAAGYTGLLVWHGGLSGSAPLTVATADHFLVNVTGIIPVFESIFSLSNLVITLLLLAFVPLFLCGMLPRSRDEWVLMSSPGNLALSESKGTDQSSPARKLEESRGLALIICLMALLFWLFYFGDKGLAGLNLNSMNAVFLFLGFLFFMRPLGYVKAVGESVRGTAGILLQFPFYAGIMGMMRQSGLVEVFSQALISISNQVTFPVFTFFSAGLVNLFVPSGGGQWAVQGPILIEAASALNVPASSAVMALAYGDQWTNMLQPFWALPLLGITGLKARQIIGYTAALMFLVMPLIILGLLAFR